MRIMEPKSIALNRHDHCISISAKHKTNECQVGPKIWSRGFELYLVPDIATWWDLVVSNY